MKKRLLMLFFVLCAAVCCAARAGAAEILDSGTCGVEGNETGVWRQLFDDGTFAIGCSGAMADYDDAPYNNIPTPWDQYRESITSAVIESGVTTIGDYAFLNCDSLTSVTIPDSVTFFGGGPFSFCISLTEIMVDSGNSSYTSVDGVLFSGDRAYLIQYPAKKLALRTYAKCNDKFYESP